MLPSTSSIDNSQRSVTTVDYNHIEIAIANRIKARLSKNRGSNEFKYFLKFKRHIKSEYKERKSIPDSISNYDTFIQYFDGTNMSDSTPNRNDSYSNI